MQNGTGRKLHFQELNEIGERYANGINEGDDLIPSDICEDCMVRLVEAASISIPEALKQATEHGNIGPAVMWGVSYGIRVGEHIATHG